MYNPIHRRRGRVVECARLEIVYTGNGIKGSNPFVSARNIEHPTVNRRDVSFAPESGDFYQQRYQCMFSVAANCTKIRRAAYLAQNIDASLYCFLS